MRKVLIFTSIFTITLFSAVGQVAAQADEPVARTAGACDLTPQVQELAAFQADTSLSEIDYLNAEINVRRKLLGAVIDCDRHDIAIRVEALAGLPDSVKLVPAYREILEDMARASQYYESRKGAVASLGLRDLRSTSREIAAWRAEAYVPMVTWGDNFLIWANNQQFLERASGRLSQISRVAFSLKLVNQDEVNNLFESAKNNFDIAFKENDRAREALDQRRPTIALGHIQASLRALADTYQIFFTLQETLKNIVR